MLSALLQTPAVDRVTVFARPGKTSAEEKLAAVWSAMNSAENALTGDPAGVSNLKTVTGDVQQPDMGLSAKDRRELLHSVDAVVHAAADTRFRCPPARQRSANVEGTRHMLRFASDDRALRRFVLVSTNCVAGKRTGKIAESIEREPPEFVNHYEQSKWEAEQLAADSGLPVTVVRLATCVGSEMTGQVFRLGGLHHGLRWMMQGLVPMMPGDADCRVDLISSELAAGLIARAALDRSSASPLVCHASAGCSAPRLGELMDFLVETFRQRNEAWRRGQITPPAIVNERTFASFRQTVDVSGDLLFQQVIESVDAFLPALLYPKTYRTDNAARLWGGPLATCDWRRLIRRVLIYCVENDWGRAEAAAVSHA
jgi:nucleoside-diphosphate-sugar epimerase